MRLFATILLCFFCACLQAQNKLLDSLVKVAQTAKQHDSNYVLNLHRISFRFSEINPSTSFLYAKEVKRLADSLNWTKGQCLAQINFALIYSGAGNYDLSNSAYLQAINFADSSGWERGKTISLNNIADNFEQLGEFAKSAEYAQYALDINTKNKEKRGAAINHEVIAKSAYQFGRHDEALRHLNASLALIASDSSFNDANLVSQVNLGFAKTYFKQNKYEKAAPYWQKSVAIAKAEKEKLSLHKCYLAYGMALETQMPDSAHYFFNLALDLADSLKNFKGRADVFDALSRWMENKGLPDSALYYFKLFKAANDTLAKERMSRGVMAMDGLYKVKFNEAQINELKSVAAFQQQALSNKNRFLWVLGSTALLGIIALVLLNNYFTQRKKQLVFLQQQQEVELKNQSLQLELKALRAQMNPHFIFNCMNTIDAYILRQQPMEASAILQRFSKLMRNVLDNSEQQMIPVTQDAATNQNYVELEKTIYKQKFSFEINVSNELRNNPMFIPPMLVQPYIENAILHGLRHLPNGHGHLAVNYFTENGRLKITIADNGIGRQKNSRINKTDGHKSSLGMQVTEGRIKALGELHHIDLGVTIEDWNPETENTGTLVTINL
jgi:tetratricopeptide (TPR) repeat protein